MSTGSKIRVYKKNLVVQNKFENTNTRYKIGSSDARTVGSNTIQSMNVRLLFQLFFYEEGGNFPSPIAYVVLWYKILTRSRKVCK